MGRQDVLGSKIRELFSGAARESVPSIPPPDEQEPQATSHNDDFVASNEVETDYKIVGSSILGAIFGHERL